VETRAAPGGGTRPLRLQPAIGASWPATRNRFRLARTLASNLTTRTIRTAISAAAYRDGPHATPHHLARRTATAMEWSGAQAWNDIWQQGWSAPWPVQTRDFWWQLTAGTLFVRSAPGAAAYGDDFCPACTLHGHQRIDTIRHLLCRCAITAPLWKFATLCARRLGHRGNIRHLVLYGTADATPSTAITAVRGAVLTGLLQLRRATMHPNGCVARPKHALRAAVAALQTAVALDLRAATIPRVPIRFRTGHPLPRPLTRAAFGKKWGALARTRKGKRVELLYEDLAQTCAGSLLDHG